MYLATNFLVHFPFKTIISLELWLIATQKQLTTRLPLQSEIRKMILFLQFHLITAHMRCGLSQNVLESDVREYSYLKSWGVPSRERWDPGGTSAPWGVSHCCMIASHDVNALTGAFHLRGPAQDNGITPFDFSFEHLSFSSVVSRPTSAALRHLARVIGF